MLNKFKAYYGLTKPGIIRGNLITASAGLFLAFKGSFDLKIFVSTLVGMGLVIGASCVFNNYIDRGIDKKMSRTKHRALVEGTISVRNALTFGTLLALVGFVVLLWGTNFLTFLVGVLGAVFYVVIYGIGKRKTVHGTLIGSISGATPPVAGYTAVTGSIDIAAVLLFVILVLWQMPHFFAIASYRRKEYAAAGLPVLSVKKDITVVRKQMIIYIILFTLAVPLLTLAGYTGYSYLIIMLITSIWWLSVSLSKYKTLENDAWARKVFHVSLLVITIWSLSLSVDHFLP